MESSLLAEHQVRFNAKECRVRCIGHIINLSLQTCLLASSKEALLAALTAAADVSGEELLAQFFDALSSQQRKYQAERPQLIESQEKQSGRRHAHCRCSGGSQGSAADEFSGVQEMPTLRKLHDLAV